jgi:hypothetical protein
VIGRKFDKNSEALKDALADRRIAWAGLFNHCFYLLMGAGQVTTGMLGLLSLTFRHHATVLVGHAAAAAAKISGIAMGVIYIVRGLIMGYRAKESFRIVSDFHENFKESSEIEGSNSAKIHSMMRFMEKEENLARELDLLDPDKNLGQGYLTRRFNSEFLTETDTFGFVNTYQSDGVIVSHDGGPEAQRILNPKGEKREYIRESGRVFNNDRERLAYLKAVHKGICSEEVKHKIAIVIAVSMVVAGVLTILASTVFSGGMNLLIIGLVSAVFFATMEGAFINYDNTAAFTALRDWKYSEPQWLKDLENDLDDVGEDLIAVDLEEIDTGTKLVKVEEEPEKVEIEISQVQLGDSDRVQDNLSPGDVFSIGEVAAAICHIVFAILK